MSETNRSSSTGCGCLVLIIFVALLWYFAVPRLGVESKNISVFQNEATESIQPVDFENYRKEFDSTTLDELFKNEPVAVKSEFAFLKGEYYKVTTDTDSQYIYIGSIKDAAPNGKGMLISNITGSIYIPTYFGNFKDGQFSGYGQVFLPASEFYMDMSGLDDYGLYYKAFEGIFSKNEINGLGNKYILNDNMLEKEELMKFLDANSDEIEMLTESSSINGNHLLLPEFGPMESTVHYSGEFKSNKYHGNGIVYHKNGRVLYSGGFKDDKYEGSGVLYFDSGVVKYKGEFAKGLYNGKGCLFRSDGTLVHEGTWKEGDAYK